MVHCVARHHPLQENIGKFITAAQDYGVGESDIFTTVDLYEAKNMTQVVDGIHAVGRAAQKNGFQGPVIGAKEGTENKRNFTEAQLKAGEGIVGMQAGAFVRHYRSKLPCLPCVA